MNSKFKFFKTIKRGRFGTEEVGKFYQYNAKILYFKKGTHPKGYP